MVAGQPDASLERQPVLDHQAPAARRATCGALVLVNVERVPNLPQRMFRNALSIRCAEMTHQPDDASGVGLLGGRFGQGGNRPPATAHERGEPVCERIARSSIDHLVHGDAENCRGGINRDDAVGRHAERDE